MKRKPLIERIQHEVKVVQGEAAKDIVYSSQNTFSSEAMATDAFARSVAKLLNVAGWSDLSPLTANFTLCDPDGRSRLNANVQTGDYIRITLPGPMPQNWVRVVQVTITETRADFTVQPCPEPAANNSDEVEHFFQPQARSTFRVELRGCTISAFEIGENEAINNQGDQAGDRAIINTIIAEAGWLFYQKIQWKLLTDYLVHL